MKKIAFNMLVIAFIITACAGGSTPTSAPIATEAAIEAATESGSTSTPSGSVATPEATAQVDQNSGGKVQVQVTMGDNWIKSDLTAFKVGVPYVFTVTNTGRRAHVFSISQPVPDKSASGIDAAKKGAFVLVTEDQLSPGAVVTVEYTFTQAAPAGTLEFACLIFMHYKMGQVLPIVVE